MKKLVRQVGLILLSPLFVTICATIVCSMATLSHAADTTRPTVTAFTLPATATTLTVPITKFTATDKVGVTGYIVKTSSTTPSPSDSGWTATAPTSYTFSSAGTKTLYAWAKDAAGNVSKRKSASVTITLSAAVPEPDGWYAGDMHVHRSCGGSPEAVSSIYNKMSAQNLAVISLLADMGNGEVQNPMTDLPRVTGEDDPNVSTPDRIVHWDAEWHWDATYYQYSHQALGGHIVALGLTSADQIWEEYTYPIFNWVHQQNGIAGFAHMQYLDDGIPQSLDCCSPIEYPVEVALGSADFISEDVYGSDSFIQAYYRLLNAGFRPGFAAGTDYPCGVSTLGSLLTYVRVAGGQMSYRNWIEGIAAGRTVISRNGHNEFLDLQVNNSAAPGDEIKLTGGGSVQATIDWTSVQSLTGRIELVRNGEVVAARQASVAAGAPVSLTATVDFAGSGWLAARRMNNSGHVVHTAAVYITVDNAPVRASVADAEFYVQWMDNLLEKTSPGGEWHSYFPTSLDQVQERYRAAKAIYEQIALEAGGAPDSTPPTVVEISPANGAIGVAVGTNVTVAFSEAMSPATITSSTIELRDASNALVPAAVTYDSAAMTAVLNPTSALATSTTYSATIKGGSAGVADAAGNPLTNSFKWSFTTADTATGPYTIWNNSTVPAIITDNDPNAVELGVKFRSDSAGYVTGIRFYKGPQNTGAHVGNLWSRTGQLLATVTFTNETASGWQQASFSTPVAITANTTYIASYHTNVGYYSTDINYFAVSGFDNSPLHAIANGVDGGNGVYRYGAASAFPNQTWSSSNYWVDVVFK
jgi:hypothetical protein